MVDESRRGRLLATKLAALARDHGAGHDLQTTPFALGAAGIDGDVGWVLLDDRQQRGLGPALAWALRAGVDQLQILAEEGTGTLARRATGVSPADRGVARRRPRVVAGDRRAAASNFASAPAEHERVPCV